MCVGGVTPQPTGTRIPVPEGPLTPALESMHFAPPKDSEKSSALKRLAFLALKRRTSPAEAAPGPSDLSQMEFPCAGARNAPEDRRMGVAGERR